MLAGIKIAILEAAAHSERTVHNPDEIIALLGPTLAQVKEVAQATARIARPPLRVCSLAAGPARTAQSCRDPGLRVGSST
jgi:hypothetical protein